MTPKTTPSKEALMRSAGEAMIRRDFVAARGLIAEATAADPSDVGLWLSLAAAERACGRLDAALSAVERALQVSPRDFRSLLMRASLLERSHGERASGPAYGAALLRAPPDYELDDATRRALNHGRDINLRYGGELNAALRGEIEDLSLSASGSKRTTAFIDILTGRRRPYRQEPLGYFYPGLPAIEFWERDYFPWMPGLEAESARICAEMLAVGYDDPALDPYIQFPDHAPLDQWAELNRSTRWTAFHLVQHGRRNEANCARCPITAAAMERIPQPVALNRSPSAMFSVLKPRTEIPPHTGVSNTRLVAHLALTIPPGCGFRVGGETREWREGAVWVFDDTIEHAAWNRSDHPRAVLIFDVWNPLIPDDERDAIGKIMAAMDAFNPPQFQDL